MLFVIAALEMHWDILNDIYAQIQGVAKVLRAPGDGTGNFLLVFWHPN